MLEEQVFKIILTALVGCVVSGVISAIGSSLILVKLLANNRIRNFLSSEEGRIHIIDIMHPVCKDKKEEFQKIRREDKEELKCVVNELKQEINGVKTTIENLGDKILDLYKEGK